MSTLAVRAGKKEKISQESERGSDAIGCLKIPITSLKDLILGQIISVGEYKSPGLFWAYLWGLVWSESWSLKEHSVLNLT